MFGIGHKASSKGADALNDNIELSKQYAELLYQLGSTNYDKNNSYADQSIANAKAYDQQTEQQIANYNRNAEQDQEQMNANASYYGSTPTTNSSLADANASYDREQALGEEQIQNRANDKEFKANQSGLDQAGGFTQSGFNNAFNSAGSGYGAMSNAYNSLASYYNSKYTADNQAFGNIVGGGLSALKKV